MRCRFELNHHLSLFIRLDPQKAVPVQMPWILLKVLHLYSISISSIYILMIPSRDGISQSTSLTRHSEEKKLTLQEIKDHKIYHPPQSNDPYFIIIIEYVCHSLSVWIIFWCFILSKKHLSEIKINDWQQLIGLRSIACTFLDICSCFKGLCHHGENWAIRAAKPSWQSRCMVRKKYKLRRLKHPNPTPSHLVKGLPGALWARAALTAMPLAGRLNRIWLLTVSSRSLLLCPTHHQPPQDHCIQLPWVLKAHEQKRKQQKTFHSLKSYCSQRSGTVIG